MKCVVLRSLEKYFLYVQLCNHQSQLLQQILQMIICQKCQITWKFNILFLHNFLIQLLVVRDGSFLAQTHFEIEVSLVMKLYIWMSMSACPETIRSRCSVWESQWELCRGLIQEWVWAAEISRSAEGTLGTGASSAPLYAAFSWGWH